VSDEPGTPGLRAVLSSPLRDLAKGLKGVQLPSANNLKVLSTPQLETELVSAEDDIGNEVDTKAVCGERAVEQAAPVAPSPLGLDIGWSSIPHPLKVARGGEDSHVIARIHGVTLLGVFDGVGGWAELGVDPAEYARRLGLLVETALVENPEILQNDQRPLITLLTKAFDVLDKEELAGSCTASLALLTADSKLHVLNVGDSGIHVVRDGNCVFQTGEQQHYFNCPFQLGMGSDDRPTDADYYVLEDLEQDDIIIAATDGVWDNLYEAEMLHIVKPSNTCISSSAPAPAQSSPEVIARAISEASHLHGKDEQFMSPFAVNAARHGLTFAGGKLDDVTVVVSRVCNIAPSSTTAQPPTPSELQSKRRPGLMRSVSGLSVEKRGANTGTGANEALEAEEGVVDGILLAGSRSEREDADFSPVSSAESFSNE